MTSRGAAEQRTNELIIDAFRAGDGLVKGRPRLLLLTTTGARSGAERVIPLRYSQDGERLIVVASDEGSPHHPAWFHNVIARPNVVVEVGTERFEAIASLAEGRRAASPARRAHRADAVLRRLRTQGRPARDPGHRARAGVISIDHEPDPAVAKVGRSGSYR